MSEEQVTEGSPAQPTEPSNEDVNAMLQGTEAPRPPVQVPRPEATTAPDPTAQFKQFMPEFQKMLQPIQREFGQIRKSWAEQQKQTKPAYQPPAIWNEMPPDQQKAYEDVISAVLQKTIGKDLEEFKALAAEYKSSQSSSKVIGLAQSYAGKDWENLNPIAGQIYTEAVQAAEAGDEGAATFLKEVDSTQAGVAMLVNLAKQRYSQSVQAQSQKATEVKSEQARKVGTALTNTSKTESPVSVDNLPKGNNPEARAARMKILAPIMDEVNFQG